MNWDAIGAIGEVIGGVAVIATLLFLSFQIRSNTQATRAQIAQNGIDETNRWRASLYADAELHDIWRRGIENKELSTSERQRFESVMTSWWFMGVSVYRQAKSGYLKEADVEALIVGGLTGEPGWRKFMLETASRSGGDFAKLVLKRAQELGADETAEADGDA